MPCWLQMQSSLFGCNAHLRLHFRRAGKLYWVDDAEAQLLLRANDAIRITPAFFDPPHRSGE